MAQTHTFKGTARAQLTVNGARHYVYHRTAVVIVNADRTIRLLARDFVSAEHLRQSCDSRTEHVRYVNEKE